MVQPVNPAAATIRLTSWVYPRSDAIANFSTPLTPGADAVVGRRPTLRVGARNPVVAKLNVIPDTEKSSLSPKDWQSVLHLAGGEFATDSARDDGI